MALNEIYKDADSLNYRLFTSGIKSGDIVFPTIADQSTEIPGLGLKYLVGVAEADSLDEGETLCYVTLRHVGVFSFPNNDNAGSVGRTVFLTGESLTKGFGTEVTTAPPAEGTLALEVGKIVYVDADKFYVRINN